MGRSGRSEYSTADGRAEPIFAATGISATVAIRRGGQRTAIGRIEDAEHVPTHEAEELVVGPAASDELGQEVRIARAIFEADGRLVDRHAVKVGPDA